MVGEVELQLQGGDLLREGGVVALGLGHVVVGVAVLHRAHAGAEESLAQALLGLLRAQQAHALPLCRQLGQGDKRLVDGKARLGKQRFHVEAVQGMAYLQHRLIDGRHLFPRFAVAVGRRLGHFAFAAVLSAGAFLLLRALCPDEVTEIEVPAPPKPEEKPTGNPDLDKMIANGRLAISEMKRLDDAIEDEKISAAIRDLEKVSQAIFDQVRAEPKKLPQIQKFMDYYLPTTLKLLNAYDRMDAAGVSGENIDTTKRRVEDIMGTIVTAFHKQLDNLFGTDALDISTDISVLETLLAREGLAGEHMKAETTQNADGSDINLKL